MATDAAVSHPPRAQKRVSPLVQMVANDLKDQVRYRYVLYHLVNQDLKIRYRRSVLGFFWTLLNPILMMLVLSVVFSQIMKIQIQSYALYLFSGLLPWIFLASTVESSAQCLIHSEGLIRKVSLPKLLFPLSRMLINLVNLVLSVMALFLLFQFLSARWSWALLSIPLGIVLLAIFSLGLGLLVATLNTFFRDFGHMTTVLLQAWYFATPVLYPLDVLESPLLKHLIRYNPMCPILEIFHSAIYYCRTPSPETFGWAAVVSFASLGIGYAVFKRYEHQFIFRL